MSSRHLSYCCGLLCLLAAGCQSLPPAAEPVRRSQPLLGTFVVVTAYGPSTAQALAATSAAFEEIRRVDSLMSLHRTDSELARVNANASEAPVPVSKDLFAVLARALDIARETGGSFDPTIAPLTRLWGFLWKEHRFPSEADLASALPRVNHEFVQLNAGERTITLRTNGITLDLNAIAKGYAVDCAIEKLRALGVTNAMVRAGGDLRVIGAPPGESAWPVQIEDPNREGRRRTIQLRDAALSTSGSYENFFIHDGRRYSHILNPRTGRPVEGVASCTVIAPTCMESDAWATALCVVGPSDALARFGERFPILFGVWTQDGGVTYNQSGLFDAFD